MTTELLSIIKSATGFDAKPLVNDVIEDCIIYKEQTIADDGVKARHRLELRIITSSYSNSELYASQLIEALVNIGDEMEIDGIYESNMNGGGVLFDDGTQTIHRIIYFEFITRSSK